MIGGAGIGAHVTERPCLCHCGTPFWPRSSAIRGPMTDRARDANGRNDAHVARLTALYHTMTRIRAFEEATDAAVREGLVKGAAHLSIGQEAIAAGVCINLRRAD